MALYLWKYQDHFKIMPANKLINLGKRNWDQKDHAKPAGKTTITKDKITFTMPSFGHHGRWGNMVFQYIFIQCLAFNNKGSIELNRDGEYLKRLNLYDDMSIILNTATKADALILDSYQIFPPKLFYVPWNFWRAMYVSNIRRQKCYIVQNTFDAINKPLLLPPNTVAEVEGLFIVNPGLFKQHKKFILNELFRLSEDFSTLITNCMNKLKPGKTVIGMHIRRGDFAVYPLGQSFQIPIPIKYYIAWLKTHFSAMDSPVIYIASDDNNAYKEVEVAGFDVFYAEKLLSGSDKTVNVEQLDWEILRRCDVLVSSNSSFGFSAGLLNLKQPKCFRFSFNKKVFFEYNPWESEPLQNFPSKYYLWSYLYSRFIFTWQMVSKSKARYRVYNDTRNWIVWKLSKPIVLYYVYGLNLKAFFKLLNVLELFRNHKDHNQAADYTDLRRIII